MKPLVEVIDEALREWNSVNSTVPLAEFIAAAIERERADARNSRLDGVKSCAGCSHLCTIVDDRGYGITCGCAVLLGK